MNLGKPPVVEVSVAFWFEASASAADWGHERAVKFLDQFQAEYPESEVQAEQRVQVQKLPRSGSTLKTTHVPIAFRAYPPDRSRYLLTAKDYLQCIFLRTPENDYQGFQSLKAEALGKFDEYVRFHRPTKVTGFALSYVDLVRIPTVNKRAALNDFFTICEDPDEETFGVAGFIRKSFKTVPPGSQDILTFEIYNLTKAGGPDESAIPFRLEWTLQGFKGLTVDPAAIGERLEAAHRFLLTCFKRSFTPRGWALFDPQDDAQVAQ
ncbi:MAG TPA: TIGR04255 family protein [Urbifossiella sp.]|nr:TIGR04255 family protein [Urbifossiella sp.]